LWQLTTDALSPSSAVCERGFGAMNNIINDRSLITTSNAANLLFISTVDLRAIHTSKTWLGKGRAHSTSGMASEKQAERG